MLQAVKGNEGGYSGLLLHDHPKTHPRINEGAGGRLISLYRVVTGAGGVGRSRLKPNQRFGSSVKQRGSRLSQVRCRGPHLPSAFTSKPFAGSSCVGQTCPDHSKITSLTAVRQKDRWLQTFVLKNNKPVVTNATA